MNNYWEKLAAGRNLCQALQRRKMNIQKQPPLPTERRVEETELQGDFQMVLLLVIKYQHLSTRERVKCERVSKSCKVASIESWAKMTELEVEGGYHVAFKAIARRLQCPDKIHSLTMTPLLPFVQCLNSQQFRFGPHACGPDPRTATKDEIDSILSLNNLKLPNLRYLEIYLESSRSARALLRFVKAHPWIKRLFIGCDYLCKYSGRLDVNLPAFVESLQGLEELTLGIDEQAVCGPGPFLPPFSNIQTLVLDGQFTFSYFQYANLYLPSLTELMIIDTIENERERFYSASLNLAALANGSPNLQRATFFVPFFVPGGSDIEALKILPLKMLWIQCDIRMREQEFAECLNQFSEPGAATRQTLMELTLEVTTDYPRKLFSQDFNLKRFNCLRLLTIRFLSSSEETQLLTSEQKCYKFDMTYPFWHFHQALEAMFKEVAKSDTKEGQSIPKRRFSGSSSEEKVSMSRKRRHSSSCC